MSAVAGSGCSAAARSGEPYAAGIDPLLFGVLAEIGVCRVTVVGGAWGGGLRGVAEVDGGDDTAQEAELRDLLVRSVAAVPVGVKPLPPLRSAFHETMPLLERNQPITRPRARVIAETPALRERALVKTAALVGALADERAKARRERPEMIPLSYQCIGGCRVLDQWTTR